VGEAVAEPDDVEPLEPLGPVAVTSDPPQLAS